MDEPLNVLQDPAELKQQIADLRRQTNVLYIGLAVLSLTLAGFVGLQARRAGKDLDSIRPSATSLIEGYRKSEANVKAFVGQLEAYGRANSDYQRRILARYPSGSASQPATAPAPTPAPPPR